MFTIVYVVAAAIALPLMFEYVNRRVGANQVIVNILKGWPAYALNVILCAAVGLIICVLPKGPGASLSSWFLVTCVMYFGNQFFYNTFIKLLAKTRRKE